MFIAIQYDKNRILGSHGTNFTKMIANVLIKDELLSELLDYRLDDVENGIILLGSREEFSNFAKMAVHRSTYEGTYSNLNHCFLEYMRMRVDSPLIPAILFNIPHAIKIADDFIFHIKATVYSPITGLSQKIGHNIFTSIIIGKKNFAYIYEECLTHARMIFCSCVGDIVFSCLFCISTLENSDNFSKSTL